MKIQLIRPPFDSWYDNQGQLTEFEAPPIGLCMMAGEIKKNTSVQVEIIDGVRSSLDDIEIDGDIVGVTEDYSRHLSALKLLRKAKEQGATTLIGGPNVSPLVENILLNHKYIDYAVVGDGEDTLPRFVNDEYIRQIPNLAYLRDGKVIRNTTENVSLNKFYDLDDIVDLDLKEENALPLSMIRGCIKAEQKGRCSYCSIDHALKVMKSEVGWEQIRILNEKYSVDYFWETGDSFVVGNFPERFLAARPDDLSDVHFRVYVRPNQLDEKNAKILKDLNVTNLFIGVESGDNTLLENANRACTREDIDNL